MKTTKIIFFSALIVLTFTHCSTNNSPANLTLPAPFASDTTQNYTNHSLHLTYGNIFGDWMNCSSSYNGVTITANVCKTIRFMTNGTAVIINPYEVSGAVNWTLSKDQIIISRIEDKQDSINLSLGEGIYETYLTKDTQGVNLKLKAKDKD